MHSKVIYNLKFIFLSLLFAFLFLSCDESSTQAKGSKGDLCNQDTPCQSAFQCHYNHCEDIYLSEAEIPDPNFRKCLELEYKNQIPNENASVSWENEGITLSNIQQTETLNCGYDVQMEFDTIKSLKGIEYFTSLKHLNLKHQKVEDLASLNMPKHLVSLNLMGNNLNDSDIEFLKDSSYFDSLLELKLAINNLQEVSFLKNYKKLETLSLDRNNIETIDFLAQVTSLKTLTLEETSIRDIDALQYLLNLEYLILKNNFIASITPILNLQNLNYLNLESNCLLKCGQYQSTYFCPKLQPIIDQGITVNVLSQKTCVYDHDLTWED